MRAWAKTLVWALALCLPWQTLIAETNAANVASLFCQQAAKQVLQEFQASHHEQVGSLPRIAIIIDDLGYNRRLGQRAVELPGFLTLAILPHSPHGQRLAELAASVGKEVIIHLPMSNLAGISLDEGGLTDSMNQDDFLAVLRGNLQAVSHAKGVNNHMGSLLTQHREPMEWLMDELWSQNLYFVDSRTSPHSVASEVARQRGLPTLEREIFLDNERDCAAIGEQFLRLGRIARRHGQGLAIGHPYSETLAFLEALLPDLELMGLNLLPVSQLLPDSENDPSKPELRHSGESDNHLLNIQHVK